METYPRIVREITVARYVNKCFLSLTDERIGVCIFHVDFIAYLWHYSALISQKMRLPRSLGCSRVEGIRSIPNAFFAIYGDRFQARLAILRSVGGYFETRGSCY